MSDAINKLNEVVKEVNAVYFPQARIAQLEQQNKEAVEFMREIEKELEGILEQGKIEMGALKLRAETAEARVKALEVSLTEALQDGHFWHGKECNEKFVGDPCGCWISRAKAVLSGNPPE